MKVNIPPLGISCNLSSLANENQIYSSAVHNPCGPPGIDFYKVTGVRNKAGRTRSKEMVGRLCYIAPVIKPRADNCYNLENFNNNTCMAHSIYLLIEPGFFFFFFFFFAECHAIVLGHE